MITKQQCADYINANMTSALTQAEIKTLKDSIANHSQKEELVNTLINCFGDVSILVEVRDNL